MMPIFRVFSSGVWRAIKSLLLPPVVGESLVGLGHAVYVLFLFDCGTAVVRGVQKFRRQLVNHALFAAVAGEPDDPADRQADAPVGGDRKSVV